MYYPLLFEPIYKDYIWGGRKLETMGKELPDHNVAESWEIACHPDGTGIVANGEFSGKRLDDLIDEYGPEILGSEIFGKKGGVFPLLIKLIDANNDLSVQVHPDDDYAYEHEDKSLGKSEMWYVIDAEPGTKLVSGMKKDVTRESFKKAVKENKVEECLNYVEVKPGDCFNIPAGLVHAIGKGNLICEIQQNSNTTYRVYDYNRTDDKGNKRPLHVEKALDVIDFSGEKGGRKNGIRIDCANISRTYLAANEYFAAELIESKGTFTEDTKGERFHCFTVLEGSLAINGTQLKKGTSCLIPASAGEYEVSGSGRAIKSYVPNLDENIRKPLLEAGYGEDEINGFIG